MNSIRQTFGLCSIQSLLRETQLYTGKIDGLFGEASYRAFELVLKDEIERADDWDAKTIFFNLQRAMVSMGLDTPVDGVWGNHSQQSLLQIVKLYCKEKGISGYSHAWTAHTGVTGVGVNKLIIWLNQFARPSADASYFLSCISIPPQREEDQLPGFIQLPACVLARHDIALDDFLTRSFDLQLEYIFKFFEEGNIILKCKTIEDYYLSLFYPNLVSYDPDTVIGKKGTKLYEDNGSFFDTTQRGFYTIGDMAHPVLTHYWNGMCPNNRTKIPLY